MTNLPVNLNVHDLQATLASFEQRFIANEQRMQQHEELFNRLAKLEKENSALNEKIFSLEEENVRLRETLQSQKNAPQNLTSTGGEIDPTSTLASKTKISTSTSPLRTKPSESDSPWTEVLSRHRPKATKPKKAPSPQKIAAIALGFSAAAPGPQGFTYVYISCSRRYTHNQVREDLRALGAEPNRILDISFPSKSTIGFLVHVQYEAELVAILGKAGVTTMADFDPTDAKHIGDPALRAELSSEALQDKTLELHRDRCLQALTFMHRSRRPAMLIAKDFLNTGWISDADLSEWVENNKGSAPVHADASKVNAYRAAAAGFSAASNSEGDSLEAYVKDSAVKASQPVDMDTDDDQ